MPEGLNDYEKLQAKEIAAEVGVQLREIFVDQVSYAVDRSRQNTKIYTIYGVLGFIGIAGTLAIFGVI